MNILITGCAGFIGSHVAEEFVKTGDIKITGIDSLTYAGSLKNIELIKNYENFKFIEGDITNKELVKNIINLFVLLLILQLYPDLFSKIRCTV